MSNVNSFFRTKLAQKKKEDSIIDPGEAAAAGMAIAYGPFAQKVFPFVSGMAIHSLSDIGAPWEGDTAHGLKNIRGQKFPDDLKKHFEDRLKLEMKRAPSPEVAKAIKENAEKIQRGVAVSMELGDNVGKPRKLLGGLFSAIPKPAPPNRTMSGVSPVDVENIVKIQDSVNSMLDKYKLPEKGVRVSFKSGPLSLMEGPSYDWSRKEINIPRVGKESFLHEIGHASHLTGRGAKAANLVRNIIHKGANIAVPLSYIVGDEIQKMFPGEMDDRAVKFVQDHAPAIISSTYAASTLYPEVQATTRAVKHVYETEGAAAAKKTFKKLILPLLSYVIPVIPSIVGLGMARKWHREAKEKEQELKGLIEKDAGVLDFIPGSSMIKEVAEHASYIGNQVLNQSKGILRQPLKQTARDIYEAGKNFSGSPEFAAGASMAGLPAALTAYVAYNTPHGKAYTEKVQKIGFAGEKRYRKAKKLEKDSLTPLIIGTTAALSGGFLAKLWSDIYKVM